MLLLVNDPAIHGFLFCSAWTFDSTGRLTIIVVTHACEHKVDSWPSITHMLVSTHSVYPFYSIVIATICIGLIA